MDKELVPNTMEDKRLVLQQNAIVHELTVKNAIQILKNPRDHYYSVGTRKSTDPATGETRDVAMTQPDATLVQLMANVQNISTEITHTEWHSRDDMRRASYTVKVRGWVGSKDNPKQVVEDELTLSMPVIWQKYAVKKLQKRTYWDRDARKRVTKEPEWEESSVQITGDGRIEPIDFQKKMEMFGYLTDQYEKLDRIANTKCAQRVQKKLLSFEARDPEEIIEEEKAAKEVADEHLKEDAEKKTRSAPTIESVTTAGKGSQGFEKVAAMLDDCKSLIQLDAVRSVHINGGSWTAEEGGALIDYYIQKKAELTAAEKEEPEREAEPMVPRKVQPEPRAQVNDTARGGEEDEESPEKEYDAQAEVSDVFKEDPAAAAPMTKASDVQSQNVARWKRMKELKGMQKAEVKDLATRMGLDVPRKVGKEEIIDLILAEEFGAPSAPLPAPERSVVSKPDATEAKVTSPTRQKGDTLRRLFAASAEK